MRIGIIGGGNGGLALGAILIRNGHSVNLWNRSEDRMRPILKADNTIEVNDEGNEYCAKFENIRWGYPISLSEPDIIFVITPSIAHEDLGRKIPGHISSKIPIVLMPGRTYGSYAFLKNAQLVDSSFTSLCIETQTLLHACRAQGNRVMIYGTKKNVKYSALQEIPLTVRELMSSLLPQMEYCESYFEVALNNVGAFFHPIPTILNSGWIESGSVFKHYIQGISPRIADYIQRMDDEKGLICSQLGVKHVSLVDWLRTEYAAVGNSLYDCLQSVKAYQEITSAPSLDHRYVYDDLPTGLVPIYKTALALDVKAPTIEAFLKFACSFLGKDYIAAGRDFPKEYDKRKFPRY